jgi:hypothetical protein
MCYHNKFLHENLVLSLSFNYMKYDLIFGEYIRINYI